MAGGEAALPRIEVGHFEASGATVTLSFAELPDALIAWNETKFATNTSNCVLFWTRGYAAGDASILQDQDAGMQGVVETTNGITTADTVSYAESNSDVTATKTVTVAFGSAFYGADSDEIHYVALWGNKFTDHGDINA